MTPLVWANFPLALLFILAVAGIPLWLTLRRPPARPDFSQARAYLAAKRALERGAAPAPAAMAIARRHATADRTPVPGRRHAVTVRTARTHPAPARQHTGA